MPFQLQEHSQDANNLLSMFCSWAGKKWLTQMLSCLTMHQWPSKISIESYNQTNCTKVSLSGNLFVFLPMVVFVFVATEKKRCCSFAIVSSSDSTEVLLWRPFLIELVDSLFWFIKGIQPLRAWLILGRNHITEINACIKQSHSPICQYKSINLQGTQLSLFTLLCPLGWLLVDVLCPGFL